MLSLWIRISILPTDLSVTNISYMESNHRIH